MKLFGKKDDAAGMERETSAAQTAAWTGGNVVASRAATAGLWAFLILWPLIAALVVSGGSSSASSVAPKQVTATRSVQEQSAGAVASGFVGAWLSATGDDSTELNRYTDTSQLTLPKQPWSYRDLAVVSIGAKTAGGLIPVEVAADIEETSINAATPKTSWQIRYFSVTVHVDGDAVAPVGLPAVVAGPAKPKSDPALNYPTKLDSTSAPVATVSSFLAAYLTGSGDVSVYVTPKVNIQAIDPAPYSAVKVDSTSGDAAPAANPRDGDQLHVLATAELVAGTGQQVTANYALTLTARADRWEVTSIDPTPAETRSTTSK